jgi:LPS export ABC transporter protein LptC
MRTRLFVGLFFLISASWACFRSQPEQGAVPETDQRVPDQESWNSVIETMEMNRLTAKIWYGHMAKYQDEGVYEFDQNIRVEFFDERGRRSSWLTAQRGKLWDETRRMEAWGNVVAHSDSANITLFTEHLIWDDQRKKILSDVFVTLTTDQDTLYGVGFESEADLTRWYIKKPRGYTRRPIDVELEPGKSKQPEGKK